MYQSSPNSAVKLLSKPALGLLAAFILIISSNTASFAKHYSTVRDGLWSDANVWKNQQAAPFIINLKDTIEINHIINAHDLKINNLGTLIINNQLNANMVVLNGPESSIIIEPGGVFSAQNISGNLDNILDKNLDPLPVNLLSFALKNGNGTSPTNTLIWKTAQEKNNAYFSIEKSADAKTFTEAGRVEGKNTNVVSTYTFEDKNPMTRTYYRLKQVDLDGTFTYSEIICATRNQKYAVMGHNVVFNEEVTGRLRLLNLTGQEVKSIRLNNAASYTLPAEMKGVFLLELEAGNKAAVQRIML